MPYFMPSPSPSGHDPPPLALATGRSPIRIRRRAVGGLAAAWGLLLLLAARASGQAAPAPAPAAAVAELNATSGAQSLQDGSGAASYAPNLDLAWRIWAPEGHLVFLAFAAFATEGGLDFVAVYDGPEASSAPRLFRGAGAPALEALRFTSSGRALLVTFHSDSEGSAEGFSATYAAVRLSAPSIVSAAPVASAASVSVVVRVLCAAGEGAAAIDVRCAETGDGGGGTGFSASASAPAPADGGEVDVGLDASGAGFRRLELACTAAARTAAGAASPRSAPFPLVLPAVSVARPTLDSAEADGAGSVSLHASFSAADGVSALVGSCYGPAGSFSAAAPVSGASGSVRVPVPASVAGYSLSCAVAARSAAGALSLQSQPAIISVPPGLARLPFRGSAARLNSSEAAGAARSTGRVRLPPLLFGAPCTLELRVKLESVQAETVLLEVGDPSGLSNLVLRVDSQLRLAVLENWATPRMSYRNHPTGFVPPDSLTKAGVWLHLALTIGPGERPTCRLYASGYPLLAYTAAAPPPSAARTGSLLGGGVAADGTAGWYAPRDLRGALLADVRLWSAALSPEEVAAARAGLPLATDSLELYLPLASSLEDASGRGRHAAWSPGSGDPVLGLEFVSVAEAEATAYTYAPPAGAPRAGPALSVQKVPAASMAGPVPSPREAHGAVINDTLWSIGGLCVGRTRCAGGDEAPFAKLDLTAAYGGSLWVAFGYGAKGTGTVFSQYTDVYRFDFAARQWRFDEVPDGTGGAPTPRQYPACTLLGARFYAFGGRGSNLEDLVDLAFVDLAARPLRWQKVAPPAGSPVPASRFYSLNWAVGDSWVVVGGCASLPVYTYGEAATIQDAWLFSERCGVWTRLPVEGPFPEPYTSAGGYWARGGRAVAFAGVTTGAVYWNDLYLASLDRAP
eukprot:tig00000455_g1044.t1